MNTNEELSKLQQIVDEKTESYFKNKPPNLSGLEYFNENFWDFLGELQPYGQRLLDRYEVQQREERLMFMTNIQNVIEQALVKLRQSLIELDK